MRESALDNAQLMRASFDVDFRSIDRTRREEGMSRMPTATSRTDVTAAPDSRRDHHARIAGALARLRRTVAARPDVARRTTRSVASLGEGLGCTASVQGWEIGFDLPPALGGERAAPTPSQQVQAALGACLAMTYQLQAAERGVELTRVRVTVETESDVRGLLGSAASSPGFGALRYHVDIESPGDAVAVQAVVDAADRHSPVLADLTRPSVAERTVTITRTAPRQDEGG
jgi:uncharacterized OsmC-like protein